MICFIWKCGDPSMPASLNVSKMPSHCSVLKESKGILQRIKLHKWANVNMSPFMEMRTLLENLP